VFAGLHVVTGVASPDNLIAGYILAWAYLKSGSLFIPVTLHALGNLSVLIAEVAAWHWG
jgi:membrane protease YdiL (CAAX protease family)